MADHQAEAEEAVRLDRLSGAGVGWGIDGLKDPQEMEQREAELDRLKGGCEAGISLGVG